MLDLRFQVYFPRGVEEGQKLTLEFFTPSGHLYQELSVPVSTEDATSVSRPSRRRRRYAVTGILPVGGTAIANSSLYGTWRVEAYVDDADTACTAPELFVIQP